MNAGKHSNQIPDDADTALAQDDSGAFRMSVKHMDNATAAGTVHELGATVPWARLYRGTWWTMSGGGWVRADSTTAATLDRHHAKLIQADANVTARFQK